MELISGNYNTLHCNVLVKLNGLELLKRTLQNPVSNFLLCWTFVIFNYPASELTSYVWGIPYFWVLVGTETDQNSLLQENWFPGLPWSRPRFIAWLASIICALSQGWLAMAGVPGASNPQGPGGCSVPRNIQYQHHGPCWAGLNRNKTWRNVFADITKNLILSLSWQFHGHPMSFY